jgi:hypothetical protein
MSAKRKDRSESISWRFSPSCFLGAGVGAAAGLRGGRRAYLNCRQQPIPLPFFSPSTRAGSSSQSTAEDETCPSLLVSLLRKVPDTPTMIFGLLPCF